MEIFSQDPWVGMLFNDARDVGHFLSTLKGYADAINRGAVTNPTVIFAAVDEYLCMPNIDRTTIERRSHAAAGICEWLINIRKYYDVYRDVDPKEKTPASRGN